MTGSRRITIAVPKGRILEDLMPLLARSGLKPEPEFFDENSRKLEFTTNRPDVFFIRVRSFDVATFVAFGGAQIGVVGSDVLTEFDYPDIYTPVDLGIGKCRLSLAVEKNALDDTAFWNEGHIRVATKYVNITHKFFEARGVQAECIKLNGAVELAPKLGLCRCIVDLVSTGKTLKANGMVEKEVIAEVTSRLIVSRGAYKTMNGQVRDIIAMFKEAAGG